MRSLAILLLSLGLSYAYIRVSMMLPLNAVTTSGLTNPGKFRQDVQTLKNGGVDAIMTDVWWGLVEKSSPGQYNWTAYLQMAEIVKSVGIKMQVVMSFHQCGTNVGDQCYVPLPDWVLSIGKQNPDIFYRDQTYYADQEYLSLGIDNQAVLAGRTGVQVYRDFMASFAGNFSSYFGNTINQVQIGMGPAGELRYPSYQLQNNRWSYCGIGAFQCYDKYMLADLKTAASNANHPEWGNGGPNNAGNYNSHPSDTGFFGSGTNNYQSAYGQFFLNWYFGELLAHADAILSAADTIFSGTGAELSAKVSGIHWWYGDSSHAAEATAGYFNSDQNNAYLKLAQLFAKHSAVFDFTCLEMVDSDPSCDSQPQELVKQTRYAANSANIKYAGENALPICGSSGGCNGNAFQEVLKEATQYGSIERFTFLRMDDNLLYNGGNWNQFINFVNQMHSAK